MSQKRRKNSDGKKRVQDARITRVVFLGTSSAQPIPLKRNVSSLVIQTTSGSLSMVDCGEGTQHQFKLSTLKIGKLRNIFITHLHGDHCYGIFGLLHSIRNDENNDFTLNIYGPKGIKQMIKTTLRLSGGLHHYHLNIIELELPPKAACPSSHDHDNEEHLVSSAMEVSGSEETDDDAAAELNSNHSNSHCSHHSHASFSDRNAAVFDTNDVIELGEIEAGIKCVACRLTHRIETFGYVFIENDQTGRLDAAKAQALGARGRQMGDLKNGLDVTLDNGTVIRSQDVLGESIEGNKVAVMQDCSDCRSCFQVAQNCDLFIHECTYDELHKHHAVPRGHSTAKMAALSAVKVNAKTLFLTHFSSRFVEEGQSHDVQKDAEEAKTEATEVDENAENAEDLMHVQRLQQEAEEEIKLYKASCVVRCAADFMSIRLGKNKAITIDKDLAITDSKKHHFQHDLAYLKLVSQ